MKIITEALVFGLLDNLSKQPYRDTAGLIQQLTQLPDMPRPPKPAEPAPAEPPPPPVPS